jgi:hypothetical protein
VEVVLILETLLPLIMIRTLKVCQRGKTSFFAFWGERGGLAGGFRKGKGAVMAFFTKFLEWIKSLFWKEEMELTLVGLQNSGKTTFVNVIAVRALSLCRCVGVCG